MASARLGPMIAAKMSLQAKFKEQLMVVTYLLVHKTGIMPRKAERKAHPTDPQDAGFGQPPCG